MPRPVPSRRTSGGNHRAEKAPDNLRPVPSSESEGGGVEFDERGQPIWRVTPPSTTDLDSTFDLLRPLTNVDLSIAEPTDDDPHGRPGYDPYDTGTAPPAPKRR